MKLALICISHSGHTTPPQCLEGRGKSWGHTGEELICRAREKYMETRADCQRTERHSSANLFKVCLVDVLLLWW